MPGRYEDLRALYGVGDFTASSVAVHAFARNTTAVDTNVRRLVSRFFDVEPGAVEVIADAIVPAGRSSDFLHAMLDFAADVCTAQAPSCGDCPVRRHCELPETTDDDFTST